LERITPQRTAFNLKTNASLRVFPLSADLKTDGFTARQNDGLQLAGAPYNEPAKVNRSNRHDWGPEFKHNILGAI
jgi:hypothetical protein